MVNTELIRAIIQDPLVVSPSLSVAEAIARMCSARSETPLAPKTACKQFSQIGTHASCLLVMDGNRLLGVLTNWDIVRLSANGYCFDRVLLSEVMSQPVITLKQSEITDVFAASQLLQQHDIHHLPIINDQDTLIGLLTLNSLYQALYPANFLRLRTASEVMTPQVICAVPEASVLEIARLMAEHRVSSVVIVEPSVESRVAAIATSSQEPQQSSPSPQAVGIITAGDLVQFQASHGNFKQTQAQRIMSNPLVVYPDDSLWIAQQQMQHKQVSQAIVEGDRRELLGIVTLSTWLQIMNPVELYKLVESLEQKNWHLEAQQAKSLEINNVKLTQELQQKTAQLQKQVEQEQLLISITTHIHSSLELQDILNSVVINIQSFLQCDRVLVYQFHADWSGTVTAESVLPEWQSSLGNTITDSCFQDKINQLYMRGIKHSVPDIYQAGYPDCYVSLLEHYQVKANLVVPILLGQQIWGLLIGHQCTGPRLWESTDLDLLDKIAVQIAIAIQRLQAYERNLQGLTLSLQNAMEGISQLDKQGRYLTLNRAYANTLGYEPNELIGIEWQNTIHPEDISLLKEVYQTMLQKGKAETEARGIRKDGSVFYKQITMVSVLDQEDQFNGHYCFLKDISDRKTTEEALKRHHTAIEAAIDGIAILEGDHFTYLNKSHLEMFGYEQAEDLLNKSWKKLYAPEELNRIEQEIFPILLRQRFWQGEAIATRRDGSTFIEGLSLTITENGALICVCRDITEQKQAEVKIQQANKQLLLANAELARATRLKDEFLANMSHELRTPLNAILGISEGLQEGAFGEINDNQERAIATIDRSGRHLLELINDILDLAKIESGKLDLQITSVPIKYLCESSLIFIRQMAVKKNIQLTADIPTTIPDFLADERRMRQVLINLLNNAVKFTPDGGAVRLVVRQENQDDNNSILFAIYDTGIGIAPDEISQLFQPFVQIDSSLTRQYQGTGLGLSLVQQLVQLHGGAVTVTSEVGHGSCFSVKIPYTECLENSAFSTPATEPLSNFSSQTVFVVEDTPSAAEQTTRYLTEGGLNAIIHSTGQGVLEAAIEKQPALIILDILLPDLSGWDILTQLKAHPQTQTIPVVITSVMDERSRAIALGASEYLVKPINRQQLRSVLNSPRLSFASLPEIPKAPMASMIAPPCILLAEDSAASVATLSGYLKNRGFQLIVAKDGEEAITLTETHYPNVILMDIQMPKIDGLNAIRQIRANSATANIPIIALTALAMSGDREKCIDAGANEYMAKPVRLKSLVELVQRLLRK